MFAHRRGELCRAVVAAVLVCLASRTADAQTINTYDVNFTGNPPTIDGVVSPGEWDDAGPAQGGWRLLRETSRSDGENSRWQAVWDDDAMYILFQSDYGNWSAGPSTGSINFGHDNLNLYFDPNVDGEPNILDGVGPDGYQIAFNQYMGASSIDAGAIVNNTGVFTEAHENLTFGNQGLWEGLLNTTMSQVMTASGGVTEIKVTWTDFDADNPENFDNLDVQGLYHNFAPEENDTWYFKISRISSDPNNFLPDWNVSDSQFFADRPHGEITFVKPGTGQLGDTNGDGVVDIVDLNNVRNNFGGAGTGDTNDDGTIDIVDLNNVRNNFGAGGGNPVPEPHALGLLVVGAAACCGYRRVRRQTH